MDITNKISKLLIESNKQEDLFTFNGKKYELGSPIKFTDMKVGDVYIASYVNNGKSYELFEFTGFSNAEEEHGESGPKFSTWNEVKKEYGISSLKDVEKMSDDHGGYGHDVRICGKWGTNDEGCYYYVFRERWSRGSGADKISLFKAKEIK